MSTPLDRLSRAGVSVWVDSIARDWLERGELLRLRDTASVVGVTSNPTIFEAAMTEGTSYDREVADLAAQGLDTDAIFEHLALADIRTAADQLADVHRSTGGADGYVSFEVAPTLARDGEGSAHEAKRLWDELDRPNVMIKIPATREGLVAVRAAIAAGINVNVTLIFSLERYREVVEAYLQGLEDRVAAGAEIDSVASVASFFVSRVDGHVDPLLRQRAEASDHEAELARARIGTAAIDNARLAYRAWSELFSSERWRALSARGARPQRCLWASTSTKDPAFRDVVYCEQLVGQDTVNTMPLATLEAFQDHGNVEPDSIGAEPERAGRLWDELASLGIHEQAVTDELERDGLDRFASSYRAALDAVAAKAAATAGR